MKEIPRNFWIDKTTKAVTDGNGRRRFETHNIGSFTSMIITEEKFIYYWENRKVEK